MNLLRSLLQQTVTLHELDSIAAIDAFEFDRVAASRQYATRTDYRFRSLKTTPLIDCSTRTILDVHYTTTSHMTRRSTGKNYNGI